MRRSLRILLLCHYWAPEVGAPQRRWQWLSQGLVERGHELAVLTPAPHYPGGVLLDDAPWLLPGAVRRDVSGAMVHRTAFRPYDVGLGGRSLDQAVASADALRIGLARFRGSMRPDVIVGSVPGLPTLPVALSLGAVMHRPVVAELRDAWPDILDSGDQWDGSTSPQHGARQLGTSVSAAARRLTSAAVSAWQRQASAVVTTTESFAAVLAQRGVERAVTIRNTAAAVAPVPPLQVDRADPRLRVLYLGTVGRAQGLVSAVKATRLAQDTGTPMVLRVVGDGAELAAVRQEAERLAAPVEVLPPVPATQVAAHYTWADSVLVSLQDWPAMRLTVPSKLYEVLKVGRHISGAVCGEAAQVISDSGGGDVVAPQDPAALAALWGALARDRSRLQVSGADRWLAAHASPEVMVSRYEELLQEVARG